MSLYSEECVPQNMSQDFIKRKYRGKENMSLNRNSIKMNSITQVIEKSQQFQNLHLTIGEYWGQVKLNRANGIGSCHLNTGGFYYGEWKNNIIHGIGIYFFNVGGYIKGEFQDGKAEGNCELCYQNGQLYQGTFKQGKQQGLGVKTSRRGKEVVQYKDGIRINVNEEHSQKESINQLLKIQLPQIYIHQDRTVYGLQCDLTGLGVIQYKNGRVDMGQFQNGFLNGKGRIIFKSGDIYDGQLQNGQFQGQGFYLNYNSKQMTEGIFEKNQIVSIENQVIQYPPKGDDEQFVVDQRINIKNLHLKSRGYNNINSQYNSEKKPNKVNKIQNLIQHMLNPIKHSFKSESVQHEDVLDNLLSRVQSPQQRKNLEQIINQVTSPQRIR
ncbi:unnamed protein product [Paramecium primaurelia]|uniref:MORN repeat protein n=1 Tax=Paramecium primaurelia TaxID=5886 RepID=A0A8S1P8J0_PARPR|nr:unnamed protein product [Paramecium primaurelia]